MRILHILSDSNVGGAGILLENLLRHTGIPKREIYVLLPRGAAMADRLRGLGVQVREQLSSPDRSLSLSDLLPILSALHDIRPAVLHTHASLIGRIAGRLAGVPVRIATRHCAYPVGQMGRPLRRLLHRTADAILTTCTVATAHAAVKNLQELGIPARKIIMIRNGAEPLAPISQEERRARRAALGIGEDCFCLGMAARLVRDKGQDILLCALAKLRQAGKDAHALLLGEGGERAALEGLAARLGIAEHVTFTGYVPAPADYVNLFDAAVNCSRGTETSCLALSEAMSLGIPILASDYGGNPEMVTNEENGLLFPAEDADACFRAALRLIGDRELYARLSRGARARFATELNATRMAAEYDALYRRLAREV